MKLSAYPQILDVIYQVFFTEPLFEVFADKNRQDLIKNLLKSFALRLNDIKFASDFRISDKQDMRKISFGKKKYTLKQILEETRDRIGNNIFFNWQISRNNCQMLVKEILITLEKFTKKNEEFMFQHEFAKHVKFSDFSLHIINTISNICNTIESIVGKTLYF